MDVNSYLSDDLGVMLANGLQELLAGHAVKFFRNAVGYG
jgi:hypothetical protein